MRGRARARVTSKRRSLKTDQRSRSTLLDSRTNFSIRIRIFIRSRCKNSDRRFAFAIFKSVTPCHSVITSSSSENEVKILRKNQRILSGLNLRSKQLNEIILQHGDYYRRQVVAMQRSTVGHSNLRRLGLCFPPNRRQSKVLYLYSSSS